MPIKYVDIIMHQSNSWCFHCTIDDRSNIGVQGFSTWCTPMLSTATPEAMPAIAVLLRTCLAQIASPIEEFSNRLVIITLQLIHSVSREMHQPFCHHLKQLQRTRPSLDHPVVHVGIAQPELAKTPVSIPVQLYRHMPMGVI